MREMIRQMMLYHTRQFDDTTQRIEQARALIDFLASSVPTMDSYYGLLLKSELELVQKSRDWYLFHEHLEEFNAPIYFYQFVERAAVHGLQYLGEADFSTMLTSGFPKEVADTLERISPDIVRAEQYMDFLRNRFFRQTLLCHKMVSLRRVLEADSLEGLLIASAAAPESSPLDLAHGIKQSFRTPGGPTVETDFPLTKAALTVLSERWPQSMEQDTLLTEALRRLDNGVAHNEIDRAWRTVRDDLLKCYTTNAAEFRTWQANFVTNISDRPRVSKLAAHQITMGASVTTQRHETVNLDIVGRQLVPILDGTRDHQVLLRHLRMRVSEGIIVLTRDGQRLTDKDVPGEALEQALDKTLDKLAKAALFVVSKSLSLSHRLTSLLSIAVDLPRYGQSNWPPRQVSILLKISVPLLGASGYVSAEEPCGA